MEMKADNWPGATSGDGSSHSHHAKDQLIEGNRCFGLSTAKTVFSRVCRHTVKKTIKYLFVFAQRSFVNGDFLMEIGFHVAQFDVA